MYSSILENHLDNIYNSVILVVDDAEFSRQFIVSVFQAQGFTNIHCACDGRDGLEKTKLLSPDLVILDLMMPVLDGFGYCKLIRKDPSLFQLPILVQSGASSSAQMVEAFEAGATDFISKPICAVEVIARAKVHLENQRLVKSLSIYQDRVTKELADARIMQESVLPSEELCMDIGAKYDIDIASHFEPSSEMGGDFWGVKAISDSQLALYNVDLSGHGLAAAINTFRLHTLLQSDDILMLSPCEYLEKLNNQLKNLLPIGNFATMFYGVIDIDKNILYYSGAASPLSFILRKSGDIDSLYCSGVPIGAVENSQYDANEVEFNQGDLLFLYSDALIETPDKQGKFFSEDDITDILFSMKGECADNVMATILESFHNHIFAAPDDDLTLSIYARN